MFETIILATWNPNCEEGTLFEKLITISLLFREISLPSVVWKWSLKETSRNCFYSKIPPESELYWPECRGHVTLDRFNHTRRLTKDLLPCKPLFDHEHRALESSRKYVKRIRAMSSTRTDTPRVELIQGGKENDIANLINSSWLMIIWG